MPPIQLFEDISRLVDERNPAAQAMPRGDEGEQAQAIGQREYGKGAVVDHARSARDAINWASTQPPQSTVTPLLRA